MTTYTAQRLYELLPTIYRIRDAELGQSGQGEPLQALLGVLAREIGIVEDDITRLYANWFIETCDEWLVPYIGDLLGVQNLHTINAAGFTQRARVANTLGYRRRKGTATMLEQLARDSTLWNARVVEFFQLLSTTQSINHLRPHNVRTPDLRQANTMALIDTPFDTAAHTADLRPIGSPRNSAEPGTSWQGKYNITNVGIFLWRLQAYPIIRSTPHAVPGAPAGRFTFSPLGNNMPLFNLPQTEESITHLAEEINVPDRLRRRALVDDLAAYRNALQNNQTPNTRYFLPGQAVVEIYFDQTCIDADPTVDCTPLRPEEIIICNLSQWDAPGWQPPAHEVINLPTNPPSSFETKVAIDPVLGRFVLLRDLIAPPAKIEVSYAYGFGGDLGGGPYDRRFVRQHNEPLPSTYENSVAAPAAFDQVISVPSTGIDTLAQALTALDPSLGQAVIQIEDSRTYAEDLTIPAPFTGDLVIQAANFQRPTLIGNLTVQGSKGGRLTVNGLLMAGQIQVEDDDAADDNSLRQLDILHCTLVHGINLSAAGDPIAPTMPSLVANTGNRSLRISIDHSITGPLQLPADLVGLTVRDSIVESPVRGNRPASLTPTLVSGSLATFPTITGVQPQLLISIDNDGPYTATLDSAPATLATARDLLQSAIRQAAPSPAFTNTRVVSAENRLIILPGLPGGVKIEAVPGDATAVQLRLDATTGRSTQAVISGALAPFPTLSAAAPTLTLTMSGAALGDETQEVSLATVPASLAQARNELQTAIRAASSGAAFGGAIVGSISADNQLVIVPGTPDTQLGFALADTDATTLYELRLAHDLYLPAIGAEGSGAQPGPVTTLERVTVLGPVHVKTLELASEVLFSNRVLARRRQAGCVRFSYLPPGSRAPQRYRCQPELAISTAIEAAKSAAGGVISPAQTLAIRRQILSQLAPAFTSTRYGDPAYAQLSHSCAVEISTGAEDGSEMGAFSFLKQPQRTANLRASLDEYLRFGLEAGIFFVT